MSKAHVLKAATIATATMLPASYAHADAVADFYKGRTMTFLVGFGPGGNYGINAQLMADHMPKHIPGRPTIVVQHMPGAGGTRAANYMYQVAPKDGSLLVSELPRPDSRAARSTTTSSDSWLVGLCTTGPAACSSGPTARIQLRSACFLAIRSCALPTELFRGSRMPAIMITTAAMAPTRTMRRSRSLIVCNEKFTTHLADGSECVLRNLAPRRCPP